MTCIQQFHVESSGLAGPYWINGRVYEEGKLPTSSTEQQMSGATWFSFFPFALFFPG